MMITGLTIKDQATILRALRGIEAGFELLRVDDGALEVPQVFINFEGQMFTLFLSVYEADHLTWQVAILGPDTTEVLVEQAPEELLEDFVGFIFQLIRHWRSKCGAGEEA